MVNYETISALINQIPADTWDVLREIKERRPAMLLLELIDCRRRALQTLEPSEPRSQATNPHDIPRSDPQIDDMPKQPVRCLLDKADLDDHFEPHPMGPAKHQWRSEPAALVAARPTAFCRSPRLMALP
jgi:hypothetical protein